MHRQLKGALKSRCEDQCWIDDLPLVLLGVRSAWHEGADTTPAELLYGTSLRLPGQFVLGVELQAGESEDSFTRALFQRMHSVTPVPSSHHSRPPSHVPPALRQARSVYVRHDAVRKPLQRPYDGPFPVISAGDKYFIICKNGSPYSVSIDRLKPAYEYAPLDGGFVSGLPIAAATADTVAPIATSNTPENRNIPTPPIQTRSGRLSRPPEQFVP